MGAAGSKHFGHMGQVSTFLSALEPPGTSKEWKGEFSYQNMELIDDSEVCLAHQDIDIVSHLEESSQTARRCLPKHSCK